MFSSNVEQEACCFKSCSCIHTQPTFSNAIMTFLLGSQLRLKKLLENLHSQSEMPVAKTSACFHYTLGGCHDAQGQHVGDPISSREANTEPCTVPIIVEPIDDSAGLQVELGGEFLNGFWRWVWLLLIGSLQGFFFFRGQHHAGFLQLMLRLRTGPLAVVYSG